MTLCHNPHTQTFCLHSQAVQNRRGLIGIGINISISAFRHNSDFIKKCQGIPHRKAIQHLHGKLWLAAAVMLRPERQISQIAASVSSGKNLFSHPIHMLQNRHSRSFSGCCNGCRQSGSSASNNYHLSLHNILRTHDFCSFLLYPVCRPFSSIFFPSWYKTPDSGTHPS